jgi:hypothetical protein
MKKIVIISLVFIFLSCDDLSKFTVQVKFDQKTFAEQRQLWQEANVKNYQYQLSAIGFMGYGGTIFVENGQFKNDLTSSEYSNIENFMDYSTIDEIYKTIEEAFNSYNNTEQSKNDVYYTEIIVEYDKINHIPIIINYHYYAPSNIAVDGTFYYEIIEFSKRD